MWSISRKSGPRFVKFGLIRDYRQMDTCVAFQNLLSVLRGRGAWKLDRFSRDGHLILKYSPG